MKKIKTTSMVKRVLFAFMIFAIIQSAVFVSMITFTGIRHSVYEQSYSSFNFQIVGRANSISEELNNARSGFVPVAKQIEQGIEAYLYNEEMIYDEMSRQDIISILEISTEKLLYFLNNAKQVSGVFIYLNGDSDDKDCVYIRDNAYGSSLRSNENKIYVRGPSEVAKKYSCQLYYLWEPTQDFSYFYKNDAAGFYTKPMENASAANIAAKDLYYWSTPYKISDNDPEAITLTIPLLDSNQIPYALCGFEISSDFMKKMMPYTELSDKPGMYIIGDENINHVDSNIISGSYAEQLFTVNDLNIKKMNSDFNLFSIVHNNKLLPKFLCIQEEIVLYGKNTIFGDEKWYLYGILDKETIEKYPKSVIETLYISMIAVIALSIIYIVIITLRITKPIKKLSEKVGEIDPDEVITLPKTNIQEIDELTSAIKILNDAVISSALKLNTIIDMVGISIGAFEERIDEQKVYLTDSLVKLLELPDKHNKVSFKEWEGILKRINYLKGEDICRIYDNDTKNERWLRIKIIKDGSVGRGIIMDATEEIKELKRLEYERNYDNMTNILNRQAFFELLTKRLNEGIYDKGALLMIDLDNLKYINDTYGHETGDKYLILMAKALSEFESNGGLISRMAGDEFMVFMPYDYDSPSFWSYVTVTIDGCKKKNLSLPDGTKQKLRFSTGISRYPKDSDDVTELLKFADFAMYEAKHNIKGTIGRFDMDLYNRKSTLLSKLEMFEVLIEKEDIKYMMQAIVSASNGEVRAYEMLMRSDIEGIRTPYEILNLAKEQSKLYYVEMIGLRKIAALWNEYEDVFMEKLIFFNSIPSVLFKQEDWKEAFAHHPENFKNLVIEVSNSDIANEKIELKMDGFKKELGCMLAVDHYGISYKNDKIMKKINPDYVKIDISLVRDIHIDKEKKRMVEGIVKYCKERNIKTIAVGVEAYDEMKELIRIGVGYLQGFYISRPEYAPKDIPYHIKEQICSLNV